MVAQINAHRIGKWQTTLLLSATIDSRRRRGVGNV